MEDELLTLCPLQVLSGLRHHDLEEAIACRRVCVLTLDRPRQGHLSIDLPRPRKVEEIRFEPRFGRAVSALLGRSSRE